jgi:single-strand DNA-binding protein
MNTVSIIGRLTAKPELKQTQNGKDVCGFSVAVDRRFKDADGNAITDFIDCVAWNNQAVFLCKWFDKGIRVGITGELQTRRWEKDGQAHKVTEILVNTIEFADGKREANAIQSTPTQAPAENTNDDFTPVDVDDDLPF